MIVDENLNDCSELLIDKLNKKLKIWDKVATISAILCAIFWFGSLFMFIKYHKEKSKNEFLEEKIQQEEQMLSLEYSIGYWFINQPEEVNDSILYVFLKDNNAWYPEILLKQAKLESGNYTSNVYNNSNNLYGMKKVGKRLSTQLKDTYNGYGCYTNWCESVLDRILWDIYYFKGIKPTREEYLNAMSFYAEDLNYIQKLN